jgi:hypothetical protein
VTRFTMVDMTPEEAGKFLRNMCELTASQSRDWDNMQTMITQFLTDAYKGGKSAGIEAAAKAVEARGIFANGLAAMHEIAGCAEAIRALIERPEGRG